jgi:hypothetical protein
MFYAKIVSLMVAKFEFSNLTLQHWKIIVHIREWLREREKENQLFLAIILSSLTGGGAVEIA